MTKIDDLWDKFYQNTANLIERNGRSIICVSGDEQSPPFSYTIGNHLNGLPELLVIGSARAHYLNDFSRIMIARGRPFSPGEVVNLPCLKLPMKMIWARTIDALNEYTVQAGEYFGHQDYSVMQVLISDTEGRFPDEPGCKEPWASLPVLRVS